LRQEGSEGAGHQGAYLHGYRITRADGSLIEGVTNAHGETALKLAEFGETVKIEIL